MGNRQLSSLIYIVLFGNIAHEVYGISIPFFTSLMSSPTGNNGQRQKEARITNADHGVGLTSASIAGGNSGIAPAHWAYGIPDHFIRGDPLVMLNSDSSLNKDSWRDAGYFAPQYDPVLPQLKPDQREITPMPLSPPPRIRNRKIHRKSKQEPSAEVISTTPLSNPAPTVNIPDATNFGGPAFLPWRGLYDLPAQSILRDMNVDADDPSMPIFSGAEPYFFSTGGPVSHLNQAFPYSTRANSQALPPEAVIQFLKSPEQELGSLTRPTIKLPFPLSHDCGSGSGSKPLQFVVLPIVEPVAPFKVLFPKPFLTSQYGQFPYIPPFNLFKKPPVATQANVENVFAGGPGGSGQFVPILNRPAPPLPFVFVQSLPLELIGQNLDMDVLHSSSSPEGIVKEPYKPVDNFHIPNSSGPVPLIVIEKVKTNGNKPSSPPAYLGFGVPPAAAVEIKKSSIQKNNGSPPHSTISVVHPIAGGGSPQALEDLNKAIAKLVPVAAAVLENVEKQEKEQKKDAMKTSNLELPPAQPTVTTKEEKPKPETPNSTTAAVAVKQSEPINISMRPPLRPDPQVQEVAPKNLHKQPDFGSEEVSPTVVSEVEVTDAA